jgi:PhnB protein
LDFEEAMKYICLVYHDEQKLAALSARELETLAEECGIWVKELGAHFVFSAGLQCVRAASTFGGSPNEAHVPPEWKDKIMHARLVIGDQVLMGSDCPPTPMGKYVKPQGFSVTVNLKDPAESERIFKALSANGSIKMPLMETFWAKRFGMFTDRFGTPWMINCG